MSIGVEERAEQIRKIQLFSSAKNSSFDFKSFVAGDNDAFINKRSSPQDEERDVTFD
jgi:hypothetical protein